MSDKVELKPCPFCGRAAETDGDVVWCSGCALTDTFSVEDWNTRTPTNTEKDNELQEVQTALRLWHNKNFPDADAQDMLIGVMEEVGELAHANLKRRQLGLPLEEKEKDAVGDAVLFLLNYCNKRGFDMWDIIEKTWEVVRQRDYDEIRNRQSAALDGLDGRSG